MTHKDPETPETDTEKVYSFEQALSPSDPEKLEKQLIEKEKTLKDQLAHDKDNSEIHERLIQVQRDLYHVRDGNHPGQGWKSVLVVDEKSSDRWTVFTKLEKQYGRGKVQMVGVAYSHTGIHLQGSSTIFVKKS